MAKDTYPVVELFGPTMQGEGILCGFRSHFVRFGGCTYRCSWCDSMHAVDPEQIKANAQYLTPEQITERLALLGEAPTVTLSGGDPVMWDLTPVVDNLLAENYNVAVETQGAIYRPWLEECDIVTVSPKGPSSGMFDKLNYDILDKYADLAKTSTNTHVSFKVVVMDREDFDFAERLVERYEDRIDSIYLSSGTPPNVHTLGHPQGAILSIYRRAVEEVLKRPALQHVAIFPQMHVLLWGNSKGV